MLFRTETNVVTGETTQVPLTDEEIAALEEAAANQPLSSYVLQMSDFWSRFADDDEYKKFEDAVAVAPLAKDRRAFQAASNSFMVSTSYVFSWTKNVLTSAVGSVRADAIMADSAMFAGRPADEEA